MQRGHAETKPVCECKLLRAEVVSLRARLEDAIDRIRHLERMNPLKAKAVK
jgi:hypothetical protein